MSTFDDFMIGEAVSKDEEISKLRTRLAEREAEYGRIKEIVKKGLVAGLMLRCDADLKEGATKESCVKFGEFMREAREFVSDPAPRKEPDNAL